jgi:hypothetical protein
VADGFQVHPDSIRRAGDALYQASDRLAEQWDQFCGQVEARGDIFGDDAVGGLIGMSYQAAEDIAGRSYESVISAFAGYGDGLYAMADQYDSTEQNATDSFAAFYR